MILSHSAPRRRLVALVPVAALALLLQACGGNSRAQQNNNVGTSQEISLTLCTTCTSILQPAGTTTINASVLTDPNNQGVTWALTGPGTLSAVTTTSVTYTAPAAGTVTGAVSAVITATGVHDTTQSTYVTLRVDGTPVAQSTAFFPGNANTAYSAAVAVEGGKAPFTWTVVDTTNAPLPTGLTIPTTASSISYVVISGTPTATGTFPFQLKVTDANNATSTVALSITINPQAACLLNGQFAQVEVGYASGQPFVAAGSYSVNSSGLVSGYQDQSGPAVVAETVTGTCTTRTTNNGTLTLTGTKRSPTYDYATTISLDKGRSQLMNGGDKIASSAQFHKQDATAFNGAALAGEWSFGALGSYMPTNTIDPGTRLAVAGRFTLDAAGAVTAGRLDSNGTTARSAAAFTGTLGATTPGTIDAHGRATLHLSLTGVAETYDFITYVIDANHLYIVQTAGGTGAPVLAGTATRQAAGPFDGTALGTQGVLSLWTAYGTDPPYGSLALGRLSTPVVGGTNNGSLTLAIDLADKATATIDKTYAHSAYVVDADGHATLAYTDSNSNSAVHNLALYLSGPEAGYVVEHGNSNTHNMGGLLEAQAAGPYSATLAGIFVSGTQFPQEAGPMSLLPALYLVSTGISSTYTSGYIALDTATGRGIGTMSTSGSASTIVTSYQVDASNVRILRYGYRLRGPSLEWLTN